MSVIDTIFVGLTLLYLWFGSKVDQWITIAALGLKLETPQGFLEHPRAYDAIRMALLLSAAACLFATASVPWYGGAAILAVAWFATTWIGQRRAFSTYRRIWLESISDASTPEERASHEAEAKKSDEQLRDRLLQFGKSFTRQ